MRVLAELAVLDAAEPGAAFAEKLGLWLNLNQAITLHAALNASAACAPAAKVAASSAARAALGDEFTRLRAGLEQGIKTTTASHVARARTELPSPNLDLPVELAAVYAPYRRYYLAHQRDMAASVGALRVRARAVLARASSALKTLATLDAAFDDVLNERESKLLATVPVLLEKRLKQLFSAHQLRLACAGLADNPTNWLHTGAWLACFRHDLQTVLLAELELRLQPTVGLMEALHDETSQAI